MRRLILHWSGGGPVPNAVDLRSYHMLVDQFNRRHFGDLAPEANLDISDGIYARHAGGFNTGSIGMSLCGMLDATETPFNPGLHPIKKPQYEEACKWSAELLIGYKLTVTPDTCMLHSEVLPRYGAGIYKWDVNWLPGMDKPGSHDVMGNAFRARVTSYYDNFMLLNKWRRKKKSWRDYFV